MSKKKDIKTQPWETENEPETVAPEVTPETLEGEEIEGEATPETVVPTPLTPAVVPVKKPIAAKPVDKKLEPKKLLKVGDHVPHEVIHYMTVTKCTMSEAIEHYNSKQ